MLISKKPATPTLLTRIRHVLGDTGGATAIEYGFAAFLLAVPLTILLPSIGGTVQAHYSKAANGFEIAPKKAP
jgi:Flp pilus assembly pilin Flp